MLTSDPDLVFRVYNAKSYLNDFLPLERSLLAGDFSMIDSVVAQMLDDVTHSVTSKLYSRYVGFYLPKTSLGKCCNFATVDLLVEFRDAVVRKDVDTALIFQFLGVYLCWRCDAVLRRSWSWFPTLKMSDGLLLFFQERCGLNPIRMADLAKGDLASPSDDQYLIPRDAAASLLRCMDQSYTNGVFEDPASLVESFDGTEDSERRLWRAVLLGASNGSLLIFSTFE